MDMDIFSAGDNFATHLEALGFTPYQIILFLAVIGVITVFVGFIWVVRNYQKAQNQIAVQVERATQLALQTTKDQLDIQAKQLAAQLVQSNTQANQIGAQALQLEAQEKQLSVQATQLQTQTQEHRTALEAQAVRHIEELDAQAIKHRVELETQASKHRAELTAQAQEHTKQINALVGQIDAQARQINAQEETIKSIKEGMERRMSDLGDQLKKEQTEGDDLRRAMAQQQDQNHDLQAALNQVMSKIVTNAMDVAMLGVLKKHNLPIPPSMQEGNDNLNANLGDDDTEPVKPNA